MSNQFWTALSLWRLIFWHLFGCFSFFRTRGFTVLLLSRWQFPAISVVVCPPGVFLYRCYFGPVICTIHFLHPIVGWSFFSILSTERTSSTDGNKFGVTFRTFSTSRSKQVMYPLCILWDEVFLIRNIQPGSSGWTNAKCEVRYAPHFL